MRRAERRVSVCVASSMFAGMVIGGLLCPAPCAALDGEDLLFYASFDGTWNASVARGSSSPVLVPGQALLIPGISGQAASIGAVGSALRYPALGNIDARAGSLSVWVRIGWKPEVKQGMVHSFLRIPGKLDCYYHWSKWLSLYWTVQGRKEGLGFYPSAPFNHEDTREQWHHLVFTWDETGRFARYQNGEASLWGDTRRNALPDRFLSNTDGLVLCDPSLTPGGDNRTWLDEFMIFNRPLDATEIKSLYRRHRAETRPVIARIAPVKTPPRIDGVLSPEEWDDAFAAVGFSDRLFGNLVGDRLRGWLAYDSQALYVAFQDAAAVVDRGRNAWEVRIRRGSAQREERFLLELPDGLGVGSPGWEARVTEHAAGRYTMEARIPWVSVGIETVAVGDSIGTNLLRHLGAGGTNTLEWIDSAASVPPGTRSGFAKVVLGNPGETVAIAALGDLGRCKLDLRATPCPGSGSILLELFLQPSILSEYYDPETMPGTKSFTGRQLFLKQSFPAGAPIEFSRDVCDTDINSVIVMLSNANGDVLYQTQEQFIPHPPVVGAIRLLPGHEQVEVTADISHSRVEDGAGLSARVSLFDASGRELAWQPIPAFDSPRKTVQFSMRDLPLGRVSVQTSLFRGERETFSHVSSFDMLETRPDWLMSPAGIERRVPNDFEPIRVKRDGHRVDVLLWGRSYQYDGTLFPVAVRSQGHPLLARPCEVVVQTEGRPRQAANASTDLGESAPDRVTLRNGASYGSVRIGTENEIAFDGTVRTTLRVEPVGEQAVVQSLTLAVPLAASNATLIHSNTCSVSAKQFSGKTPAEWSSAFRPILWLGNEYAGMCFFVESAVDWSLRHPDRFYEVRRGEKEVLLNLNFIDAPVELKGPRTFTFGWFATPSRPLPEDWLCWEYGGRPQDSAVGTGRVVLGNDRCFDESNQFLHEAHPWDWFLDNAEKQHAQNRLFLKYTSTRYLAFYSNWRQSALDRKRALCKLWDVRYQDTPEHRFWGEEWKITPGRRHLCTNTAFRDLICAGIRDRIEKGAIDGIYFDCAFPMACGNSLHGCHGRYDILSQWEIRRRVTNLFEANGKRPVIMEHLSDNMLGPQLSFDTCYLDGEHLAGGVNGDYRDDLPLDRMRVMSIGTNWGSIPMILSYCKANETKAANSLLAVWTLHMPAHCITSIHAWPLPIWDAYSVDRAFGFDSATRRLGYWENGHAVRVTPGTAHITLYHKPGSVLVIASDLTDRHLDAEIALDAAALGLAADALTLGRYSRNQKAAPVYEDGVLKTPIAPNTCAMVILTSESATQP